MATRLLVGAGARALFYPSLLYNVVRNKLESEFRWWDYINQYLVLGAVPFPGDVLKLKELGVHGVITLNEPYETLVPPSMYKEHDILHLEIPTRDFLFAPSQENIRRAVDFIHDLTLKGQGIYVHCKAGRGRSTTVVLCYLVAHCSMSPREALDFVRAKRPRVALAPAQWQAVNDYSESLKGGSKDDDQSKLKVAHDEEALDKQWFAANETKKNSSDGGGVGREIEMLYIGKDGDRGVIKSTIRSRDAKGLLGVVAASNQSMSTYLDCCEPLSDLSNEEEGEGEEDISVLGTSLDLEGYCSEEDMCFWNGSDGEDGWGMQRVGHCIARASHSAVRTVSDVMGAAGAVAAWSLSTTVGCFWIPGKPVTEQQLIFPFDCNPNANPNLPVPVASDPYEPDRSRPRLGESTGRVSPTHAGLNPGVRGTECVGKSKSV